MSGMSKLNLAGIGTRNEQGAPLPAGLRDPILLPAFFEGKRIVPGAFASRPAALPGSGADEPASWGLIKPDRKCKCFSSDSKERFVQGTGRRYTSRGSRLFTMMLIKFRVLIVPAIRAYAVATAFSHDQIRNL